jgi:hypothetical protein
VRNLDHASSIFLRLFAADEALQYNPAIKVWEGRASSVCRVYNGNRTGIRGLHHHSSRSRDVGYIGSFMWGVYLDILLDLSNPFTPRPTRRRLHHNFPFSQLFIVYIYSNFNFSIRRDDRRGSLGTASSKYDGLDSSTHIDVTVNGGGL